MADLGVHTGCPRQQRNVGRGTGGTIHSVRHDRGAIVLSIGNYGSVSANLRKVLAAVDAPPSCDQAASLLPASAVRADGNAPSFAPI